MNELIALKFLVAILTFTIICLIIGGGNSIKAWKQTAKSWRHSYDNLKELIAAPMEDALAKCVDCPDGVDCSGCERFSKYCKKCTEGGG